MQYLELSAAPPLDQVVRCFWFLRSDATLGAPQPVVADGRLEIVLHAAEPFARLDAQGRGRLQEDALLAGQLTGPIMLQQWGRADVVGIRLRTGAGAGLIRHSIAELNNQVAPLRCIDPSLRDRLLHAIAISPDPYRRRAALSTVLIHAIREQPDPVTMAVVRAFDVPAPPGVAGLARSLGLSSRTLERQIAQATGLAPRDLMRTMRFRRGFQLLHGAGPGSMTAMALRAGYFDQAHCIREFRRFTGQSPRQFFGQDTSLAVALTGEYHS